MASPSPPRPPPIQTALASPRPRPPHMPNQPPSASIRTPGSASPSPNARRSQDPLLSRLTPSAITKMSDLEFLPGEKEVGVWAATSAEKIDGWLREVEAWEGYTFWSKIKGGGFRVPDDPKERRKRRRIDLSTITSVSSQTRSPGKPPVARRLFSEGSIPKSSSVATLQLTMKSKDGISMSEIDQLLSPTTTPLHVKRFDLDFGMGAPATPSRMHSARPASPFSPFDKQFKRRSLQVSSFGSMTPTPLKRQTFDFTPGHTATPSSTQTFRPSSSPSKPEPQSQPQSPSMEVTNGFLAVQQLSSAATSRSQSPSPSLVPTDSETEAPTSESDSADDSSENAEEFLGSLTASTVNCISRRVTSISTDLAQLDIEDLKSRVLHFKAQQIDERGHGRMSDSLAIITATTLQLLPPLHRLWNLLDTWAWRMEVCRVVPAFLTNLNCAEGIVMCSDDDGSSWLEEIEAGVAVEAISEETLATLEHGVDELWEKRRLEAVERVGLCGRIIDGMLDVLEGREETLPDDWIDRLDALEAKIDAWVLREMERADALKRRWRELIRRRKEAEEQKRKLELEIRRKEEEERRRKEEEEERVRLLAEEKRRQDELEERQRREEERQRQEKERQRREEEEQLRQKEAEAQRRADELQQRAEEEARLRKQAEEAERLQKAKEDEEARLQKEAEEEQARQAAAERLRLEQEREEQLRKAEEARLQRVAVEEERARRLVDEEVQRRQAEQARIRELEERQRLKYEAMEKAEEEAQLQAAMAAAVYSASTPAVQTNLVATPEFEELVTDTQSTLSAATGDVSSTSVQPQLDASLTPEMPSRLDIESGTSGQAASTSDVGSEVEAFDVPEKAQATLTGQSGSPDEQTTISELPAEIQTPASGYVAEDSLVLRPGTPLGACAVDGYVGAQSVEAVTNGIEVQEAQQPALLLGGENNAVDGELQSSDAWDQSVSPVDPSLEGLQSRELLPGGPLQETLPEEDPSGASLIAPPLSAPFSEIFPEETPIRDLPEDVLTGEGSTDGLHALDRVVASSEPDMEAVRLPTRPVRVVAETTIANDVLAGKDVTVPSPPVQAMDLGSVEAPEGTFSISPLLVSEEPIEEPTKLALQLDTSTDIETTTNAVLSPSELVPTVEVQAATPMDDNQDSLILDPTVVDPQIDIFPLGTVGNESLISSDMLGEAVFEVQAPMQNEGIPDANAALQHTRHANSVLAEQPFVVLQTPSIVYNDTEISVPFGLSDGVQSLPLGTRRETRATASATTTSPFLASPVPGLADDYVSDVDDSDVETVADDEEFQAELRKERFGDNALYPLASTIHIPGKARSVGKTPPSSNGSSPSKRKHLQEDSNGFRANHGLAKSVDRDGEMMKMGNGVSPKPAAASPQIVRTGPIKLSSPFHASIRNALENDITQRHNSFDSAMSTNGLPDQSFNSLHSVEAARGMASPLSPTGSVIRHHINDSFGASFNSVRSEETIPDEIMGTDFDGAVNVVQEEDRAKMAVLTEEDEVSPIKEYDENAFGFPINGDDSMDIGVDELEFAPKKTRVAATATTAAADTVQKVLPRQSGNGASITQAQVSKTSFGTQVGEVLTAVPQHHKRQKSSVSNLGNYTSRSTAKAAEAAQGPSRPPSQVSRHIRRVSSIPTIAQPRTQAQNEATSQVGQRRSHSHKYSSGAINTSYRGDDPAPPRPDSRMSTIPRKTSLSHLPAPVIVPKGTSSFEKMGGGTLKKRSSMSSIPRDRDILPKSSFTLERGTVTNRSSSRMGSSSSLRSQSSRQTLKNASTPVLPTFDPQPRKQSSRPSVRGTSGPHPRHSEVHRSQSRAEHAPATSSYGQDQGIKVVKRKNNLITKPASVRVPADVGQGDDVKSPISPMDFPSLRPVHNPPSTPMQGRELEDRLAKKINKILIGLPSLTMTPSPMKRAPPPAVDTNNEASIRQPRFGDASSKLPIARPPSTPTIGQAPNLTLMSKRTISQPGEVKMYHLHRSDDESPVKLFVRLVGDRGERVMVRVGGGWADLKEYLIEYAAHHGIQGSRKAGIDSIVEFGEDSRSVRGSGSNSSLRSSFRGSPTPTFSNGNNSRPGSPLTGIKLPVPSTSRGNTPGRAESPFSSRRPESPRANQVGTSPGLRLGLQGHAQGQHPRASPNAPNYERPVTPGSSSGGFHPSYTSPSYNAGLLANPKRPMSRLSFGDFPDAESPSSPVSAIPLGLAGPKSRGIEISAEKQAWVDGMLGQVRKASGERSVRLGLPRMSSANSMQGGDDDAASTGSGPRLTDMGKVGGTRRMYVTKQPSYLGLKGVIRSSSSLRLSDVGRDGERSSDKGL
ncbi:hypothetical protein DRE_06442 [Drechslerella stenobrocha 248]|uniref:GAR domain-containing protein n=1 Tax=Drechslerella stenobrocha 248 TaxID=1043628 RepID=W7HNU3_9PEZI|nr:hypothetical protein DRE_06442 [Drechslerella stenobrocha 248]